MSIRQRPSPVMALFAGVGILVVGDSVYSLVRAYLMPRSLGGRRWKPHEHLRTHRDLLQTARDFC